VSTQVPAGPPPPPTSAVILGQVVDADTGTPVPDVTVTTAMRAAPVAPALAAAGRGGGSQVRLLTGADGKFVVRDVPLGNVQLSATARGYVNGGYGQTRPAGPVAPFVVAPGTKVAQVQIRMWRTATITGTVTDERGEPQPGVEVRAMRRSYLRGQPRLTMAPTGGLATFSKSDDRGVYRLSGLPPGDYVVVSPQTQMSMPAGMMESAMRGMTTGDPQSLMGVGLDFALSGGAMLQTGVRVGDQMVGTQSGLMPVPQGDQGWRVYTTQFYPGVALPSQATVLSLRSGEARSGVDLALPLAPTVTVSGVVMGPAGPVPNVGVRVRHAGEGLVQDGSVDVAAATTRADGSFALVAVPTGNYVVRVLRSPRPQIPAAQLAALPEEMKALLGPMAAQSPLDGATYFADIPLALDRDVSGLVIPLTSGATIAGRLEFEGAAAAPPTQGLTVALTAIGGDWAQGPLMMTATAGRVNADGTFVTTGYPPGRYVVTTGGRSVPGWFVKSVTVNGRDALYEPFELEGRNLTDVVVTFTDKRSTIGGTVQPQGGGDASASIVVFPSAWREWIAGGMSADLVRLVRAQADGLFAVAGLPPREYLVVAVEDTAAPDIQDPTVFEALARVASTVTVGEGETRSISLRIAQVQR
jgi:hypothetical protein